MSRLLISPEKLNISTVDRIISAARGFFARKGYYGTSIRDIAGEVNLSIATLYYYVADKDDLYVKVFQREFEEESAIIDAILVDASPITTRDPAVLRNLLYRLIDSLIDRSISDPDIVRLWTLRWLEKPEKTKNIELQYSVPSYKKVEQLLIKAQESGTINPGISNPDIITHSFTWLHYGYFGLGRLTFRPEVSDPFQQRQIEEFRTFIRIFIDRMLRFSDQDQDSLDGSIL